MISKGLLHVEVPQVLCVTIKMLLDLTSKEDLLPTVYTER